MAATGLNLQGRITLKDDASRPLESVKRQLTDLLNMQGVTGSAIGTMIGGGLAGLAGVALETAAGTMQAAWALGEMGATAQRTETSFERLAMGVGESGQAMLGAMAAASQGTVANADLMMAANRAMVLGVADSAEEMAALTEAAIIRGRDVGVGAAQAVSDLVTGIGRMSPEILDNLGIANASGAFKEYAVELGKTADQLTEVEKKQALVNAVLASTEGVDLIDDAASSFERMDAALANAKKALGVMFSPAVAAIANQLAEAVSGMTDAMADQADAAARTAELQRQLAGTRGEMLLAGIDDPAAQQAVLAQALAQTQQAQQQAAQEAVRLAENTQAEIAAIYASTPGISQADATQIYEGQLAAAQAATMELQAQAQQIVAVMGGWIGAKDTQAEYNRTLWEGVGAWTAFRTEAQIARDAVMASSQQIAAAAQGQLASIAQGIAAAQGDQAGLDWLEMMNRLLDDQIAKWAEEGRTVAQITGVLLPNFLDNLRKVADGAKDAQTAVAGIAKGAQTAGTVGARMMAGLAIKIGTVTRAATIAAGAISRMSGAAAAVSTGRGGGLGEGFRTADYEPIQKATDSMTAFDAALGDVLDTAYTGGGGGGISGIGDAFDDLRGKIEGVIGEAMGADIGGLDPASFLPREDAINENARRLGAIMRDGIAGQEWLDEFKAEVPALWEELSASGDPKGAAARMLQEFQQGLRPELLDKDMIKARVKAMILGEENTAALAAEIAAELSGELGMSLAQAQQAVAGVMGAGVGGLAGGMAGGGQVGPDGAAQGTQFVAAWAGMVKSQLTEFENTGKQAGSSWGAGFMATVEGGVPGQLIALLVTLVTPGVLANMAAQGSRTGAQ